MTVFWIIGLLAAAAAGFAAGWVLRAGRDKAGTAPETPPAYDREQKRAERSRREYENFLAYNGDEQEDILL